MVHHLHFLLLYTVLFVISVSKGSSPSHTVLLKLNFHVSSSIVTYGALYLSLHVMVFDIFFPFWWFYWCKWVYLMVNKSETRKIPPILLTLGQKLIFSICQGSSFFLIMTLNSTWEIFITNMASYIKEDVLILLNKTLWWRESISTFSLWLDPSNFKLHSLYPFGVIAFSQQSIWLIEFSNHYFKTNPLMSFSLTNYPIMIIWKHLAA